MSIADVNMKRGDGVALFTRAEYEEKLVEWNRLLADVKSRYGQIEVARDVAKAAYRRAKEWRSDVLRNYQRQNVELDRIIDQCEFKKIQLTSRKTAYWDAWDKSYELRTGQYDRALAKIRSKMEFESQKWKTMADERAHKATLMNKIESIVGRMDSLKVILKTKNI